MNLTQKARREFLSDVGLNPDHLEPWGIKWRNQKSNSTQKGNECKLSFEDYVNLAIEAGIKDPRQIGTGIDKYHLCRSGDVGPYEIGNCWFKPHKQNQIEKALNGGNAKTALKNSKRFEIISPQGDVFVGVNLNDFCREHDLNRSNMSKVCSGNKDSHKGWKGRYLDANTI